MCMFIVVGITAGNDEEFFLRGNKYYAQKDYKKSLDAYNSMDKKGRAVLYNMGNCSFYLEDYSYALVYWNRAQVGATPHEYYLIERSKKEVLRKMGYADSSWWSATISFVSAYALSVSVLCVQLILLLLCWLFICMLSFWKHTRMKNIARGCMSIMAMWYITILSLHHYQRNRAIVVQEAQLMAGPDKSFNILAPLSYAQNVRVKESRKDWHKIKYGTMIGWVKADAIQII